MDLSVLDSVPSHLDLLHSREQVLPVLQPGLLSVQGVMAAPGPGCWSPLAGRPPGKVSGEPCACACVWCMPLVCVCLVRLCVVCVELCVVCRVWAGVMCVSPVLCERLGRGRHASGAARWASGENEAEASLQCPFPQNCSPTH